jgi:MurNAc alpha-1-phosphate uridylyltransferase
LGEEPFLVVNGDIATDFPFDRLRRTLFGLAHLVLIPNPPHHPQGDFALSGDTVTQTEHSRYTFAGIGVYRPALFSAVAPGRFALAPLLRDAIGCGAVNGELYRGFWMDVGTAARLQELDTHLRIAARGYSGSGKKPPSHD